MADAISPLALLRDCVSADGGWGYRVDQPAHLEPTCLALLAGAEQGWPAIELHAGGDGSYRLARGRPQAVWPTALVLFTKAKSNIPAAQLKPIIDKLLTIEGKVVRLETSDAGDIDAGLLGWPWASDTFSWVEPTAWACLALRAAGQGAQHRVQAPYPLLGHEGTVGEDHASILPPRTDTHATRCLRTR